jgi:hypothetical protein
MDREKLGRAAITAYAANIHSFNFYSCRFRCTNGQAKSIGDAIQGKILNAVTGEYKLLEDEEKDIFEGLSAPVPPNEKQAKPVPGKQGMFTIPASSVSSERYLANGKMELAYTPQMRVAGLWSVDAGNRGIDPTPLGKLGIGHRATEGPDVLLARPDEYEMQSDGMQELDGKPVLTIRIKNKKYDYVIGFSFDIGRGYLPIRRNLTFKGRGLKSQTFVTDIRECSNQRWFPERIVYVSTPDVGDLYGVQEFQVLDFDADRRPSADEFTIKIPAGTQVNDPNDAKKFFNLKQEEKINVDDLSKVRAMLDQVPGARLMDTAIPHTSPYLSVRWIGGAIGLALGLAGALVLLWRRWRRRLA